MVDNKWVICSMTLIPVPFLQILTLFVKFLGPFYGNGFVYYDCMLTNKFFTSLTLTAFDLIVKENCEVKITEA